MILGNPTSDSAAEYPVDDARRCNRILGFVAVPVFCTLLHITL